jgi:hypothetical protein
MPGPTSQKSPSDVVIVSALRTPLCRARKGAFAKVPPSTLLTTVLQAALEHNGKIEGKDVEDICLGNCLMPPSGFAAMRMAQIVAGIPDSVSMGQSTMQFGVASSRAYCQCHLYKTNSNRNWWRSGIHVLLSNVSKHTYIHIVQSLRE